MKKIIDKFKRDPIAFILELAFYEIIIYLSMLFIICLFM